MKRNLTIMMLILLAVTSILSQTRTSTVILEEGFEGSTYPPEGWIRIDSDGDGHEWILWNQEVHNIWAGSGQLGVIYHTGLQSTVSMSYLNGSGNGGVWEEISPDNWLITPALTIPIGAEANLQFYVWTLLFNHPQEHYGIFVSTTTPEPESFTQIYSQTMTNQMTQPSVRNIDLSMFSGETIYVAFRHYNVTGRFAVALDDISVTISSSVEYDLAALSIVGANELTSGIASTYQIEIRNMASAVASGYTVRLLCDETVVVTTPGITLASMESYTYDMVWTPTEVGLFEISGEIVWDLDQNLGNNVTEVIPIRVSESGLEIVFIGDPNSILNTYTTPIGFCWRTSLAQTIYFESEINTTGLITHIEYRYQGAGDIPTPRPIQLYFAVIDNDKQSFSSTTDWVPFQEFTLVFDGYFPANVAGMNDVILELDIPYFYESGNLVIMGFRDWDYQPIDWWSTNNLFRVSNTLGNNRTISRQTDNPPHIVPSVDMGEATVRNHLVPNISLFFKTGGTGMVSGNVTSGGLPLSDAIITINELNRTVHSDSNGNYLFDFIEPGVYSITASKLEYSDVHLQDIEVHANEETIINIEMFLSDLVTITGRIISSSNDLPIADAHLTLSGYISLPSVTTNAEGVFTISNVYGGFTYSLAIRALKHKEMVINNIFVPESGLNLYDIMLSEATYPPRNVTAVDNSNYTSISWEEPNFHIPGETWFSQGGDTHHLAIGGEHSTYIEFTPVHRYTESQLITLGATGHNLTKVAFWANNTPNVPGYGDFTVVVYTGGSANPLNPGTLVHSQLVASAHVVWNGWTEVVLSTPVPVPSTGELWIGYEVRLDSGHVASIDNGPANDGYGNIVRWIEGSWHTLSYLNPSLDYNWLIKGFVEPSNRSNNPIILSMRKNNISQPTYNLYRTNGFEWTELATGLTTTEYDDYDWYTLPNGEYRYHVVSVLNNNNISESGRSNLLQKIGINSVYIGNPNSPLYSTLSPFNFTWRSSLVQTIYHAEEIGITGNITDLIYRFRSQGDMPNPNEVAIYMANVSIDFDYFFDNFDWVPFSEFSLVYEGMFPSNLPDGIHNIYINLDIPFNYTGGNLVLYTHRKFDPLAMWGYENGFQATQWDEDVRSMYRNSDDSPQNPANPGSGIICFDIPNITFSFSFEGLGSLEGVVTSDGNPVENVLISINDSPRTTYTNAEGYYSIANLTPGVITITASKLGFANTELENITILPDETTILDINIIEQPYVNVFGKLISSDLGLDIADAVVTLTGYLNYETTSDNNGYFIIPGVYTSYTYELVISKPGYHKHVNDLVQVSTVDLDLGTITLYESALIPRNVIAGIAGDNVIVSWEAPSIGTEKWFTHSLTDDIAEGIGQNFATQYIKAHRFSSEQLDELGVAGSELRKVAFFPFEPENVISTEIRIYTGGIGSPLYPGRLVHTQPVTTPLSYNWIEVELNTPIYIPMLEELWIGVYYNVSGGYPLGCDNGPMSNGYGNVFFTEGVWTTLSSVAPTLTFNWAIKAMAETSDNKQITMEAGRRSSANRSNNASRFDSDKVELSQRVLETYTVYRTNIDTLNDESTWVQLADNLTETMYIDSSWADIDNAGYRYIVKAVFTHNNISGPAYSNMLDKGMSTSVTINLQTSDNSSALGSIVKLINNNDNPAHIYQQTAIEESVVFPTVWYGSYTLIVELAGFIPYLNDKIEILEDGLIFNVTLEKYYVLLSEGFEGADFPPPLWSLRNESSNGLDWMHITDNPNAAHTGSCCVASFSWNSMPFQPDSYLITPSILLPENVKSINLRYYIASQDIMVPIETYSLLISTSTPELENFQVLRTETLNTQNVSWGVRDYDLSSYQGNSIYLAWRHHDSYDNYAIKLDDIEITYLHITSDDDTFNPPLTTSLMNNYPNPFNPSTTISFTMEKEGKVKIEVFNIRGQRVTTLTDDIYSAGNHHVEWHGIDNNSRNVASGVYFYRMTTEDFSSVKRMVLMK